MSLIIGDNAHDNNDMTIQNTSLTYSASGSVVIMDWTSIDGATKYTLWKKNVDRWVRVEDFETNHCEIDIGWLSTAEYSVSAMNGTRFIGNMANTVTVNIGVNPYETADSFGGYSKGQVIDFKAYYKQMDGPPGQYTNENSYGTIAEIYPNQLVPFKLGEAIFVALIDVKGLHSDSRPMYPLKNVLITTIYKQMTTVLHYGVDNGWDSAYGGAHPPIYAPYDCTITESRNLAQYKAQKTSTYDPPKGVYVTFKYTYNGRTVTNQYEHMKEICVSTGQTIKKGDVISWMGDTGEGGNHTHISTGGGNIDNQTQRAAHATDPMNEYWFDSTYHLGDGTMQKYKKVNQDGNFFQLAAR